MDMVIYCCFIIIINIVFINNSVLCPSIDASIDFTARTGMWSKPGVLTFTIDKDGWDNYKIV